jgi:hypothetical protein
MHKNLAVSLLDPPAGERAYGRRTHGFAAAQIETGVMPGTSDAVPHYEPLTERSVVMAAFGCNAEYLGPAVNKQDFLVADMTYQFSICKLCEGNALGQIGAAGPGLFLHHIFSLHNAAASHPQRGKRPEGKPRSALRQPC